MNLESKIIKLYQKAACEMPSDIVLALRKSIRVEKKKISKDILKNILENIELAKAKQLPICQDTGTPVFYVQHDSKKHSQAVLKSIIFSATKKATKLVPLRANAVDPLAEKSIGNYPVMHFVEGKSFKIDLMLKGGGSENVGQIFKLPIKALKAQRDLDGVKKCVLSAVAGAQGKGCPPYIIGIAIGGNMAEATRLAQEQLLRKISDKNSNKVLARFEKDLLARVNKLGIGALGLGGQTTALGVKVATTYRHPASYFVAVSFGCWCLRRSSIS